MAYFHKGTFIKMYNGLAIYSNEFQGNLFYCAVRPATYSCGALRESSYMSTVKKVEIWIDEKNYNNDL